MATLFDPIKLDMVAAEYGPSIEEWDRGAKLLRQLLDRRADGTLEALCETRVEQSWNERFFAELFGYRTLLHPDAGDPDPVDPFSPQGHIYHLQPKNYYQGGKRKLFDDFSLGFFGNGYDEPKILAELKDPDCKDLEKPQSARGYNNLSPVGQAFRAAQRKPSIEWVLVSNFDEIRLYRADDQQRYERVLLSSILTQLDFGRAYALISRRTLLGDRGQLSPLSRLIQGEIPMIVDPRPGKLRFIQEVVPEKALTQSVLLHVLDDALRDGIEAVPQILQRGPDHERAGQIRGPILHGDRLIASCGTDDSQMKIELTRGGALRVSEHLLSDEHFFQVTRIPCIYFRDLLWRLNAHINFAHHVAVKYLKNSHVRFNWYLRDARNAACHHPPDWLSDGGTESPSALRSIANDIQLTQLMPVMLAKQDFLAKKPDYLSFLRDVVNELLYPFQHLQNGNVLRLRLLVERIREEMDRLSTFAPVGPVGSTAPR